MSDIQNLCSSFAGILGGEMSVKHGACIVEKNRHHIPVTIAGRPSGRVMHSIWSFESIDPSGKALVLGETALLEEEVIEFTSTLQKYGIVVSGLHNHWLMDRPPLLYAHYYFIGDPLSFAAGVAEAYQHLK